MLLRRLYSSAAHPARFKLPPTIKQVLSVNGGESSPTSVTGWIKSIRKQKNITFAVVSDGTTPEGLQAVVLKQQGTAPEMLKRSAYCLQLEIRTLTNPRLTNGTAVRLTGNLIQSPGRGQEWELVVQEGGRNAIEILGDCDIDVGVLSSRLVSVITDCLPKDISYPEEIVIY
jgi:asparaginyl-tRNA synthetase